MRISEFINERLLDTCFFRFLDSLWYDLWNRVESVAKEGHSTNKCVIRENKHWIQMARILKMDTKVGSHGISHTRTNNDPIGFPSILKQEQIKQRILVQRSKSFTARVPPPGHEYDFRRTPDPGRATPKKYINGQIRPCIPADTPVDTERLHLNASPAVTRYRNKVSNICLTIFHSFVFRTERWIFLTFLLLSITVHQSFFWLLMWGKCVVAESKPPTFPG